MCYRNQAYSQDVADDVFNAFVAEVATAQRPLYFHTDDSSLRRMFTYLKNNRLAEQPTIFPFRGPEGQADRTAWLEVLTRPEFNGCGHIRLQMDPTFARFYSVVRAGAAVSNCDAISENKRAADCIDSAALAKRIIQRFFE